MKLVVVGSGTAAPEPDRVCSGYWIEAGDTRFLLDCGPGVVHGMARLRLPWPRLDHLLISHFHNDHIGDVPMLLFAMKWGVADRRSEPLTIWAPHGIHDRLRAMAAAFGDHVADPGFPVVVREIDDEPFAAGAVTVAAVPTPHTDRSLAFRIEAAGRTIGYTGDTGPSDEVARFMASVDTLVAECSLPDDQAMASHLTPGTLAALATAAAPGQLVVSHVYPQLDARDAVARVREAGWSGPTIRARDGLVL